MYHERSLETYKDMIKSCLGFVDKIRSFIDSFLGKWSIEDTVSKIKEICCLVLISKLLDNPFGQIHMADQLKSYRLDSMVNVVEDVADAASNLFQMQLVLFFQMGSISSFDKALSNTKTS